MFDNIPHEMRAYRQWVVWRLEKRPGQKPTKVPYVPRPGGAKASVTNPADWGTFDDVVRAPMTASDPEGYEPSHIGDEPNPLHIGVEVTGFTGIGFVLTNDDPYAFIDLDDTDGDPQAFKHQQEIYQKFDSYSELSPSGKGLHIITKGITPGGRRRSKVEIYSNQRYMTMTGNVYHNAPIQERQELLDILWDRMGNAPVVYSYQADQPETRTDDEIMQTAATALNGPKYLDLFSGNWQNQYSSQSEADFALIDIIAFYTENRAQVARIFRRSKLAERDKAARDNYVAPMIERSFDRKVPPVDIEGIRIAFEKLMQERLAAVYELGANATGEPGKLDPAAPPATHGHGPGAESPSSSHAPPLAVNAFPPGLLGQIAQFIYDAAPRPVYEIALAGAIGFMSGITGRAYNVSGTGLNQYVLTLGITGIGKDAIANGTSKLLAAIEPSAPMAKAFRGPGEIVSSAGVIKWLSSAPSVYCLVGEFGMKMAEMASINANAHTQGVQRTLLQMYSKSGAGQVFDATARSDRQNNIAEIHSPALTIIGETVPGRFYEALDESIVASGLLPRFLTFEYDGERGYHRKEAQHVQPSFALINDLGALAAQCMSLQSQNIAHSVEFTPEASVKFDAFDRWTTDEINKNKQDSVYVELWNRAHLKAMKLAAVQAVGMNFVNPIIDLQTCMWATQIVVEQTRALIGKFKNGDVGAVSGSEVKQQREIVKTVSSYLLEPYDRYRVYGGSAEMHRDGVILQSHISRRLINATAFKNDRVGSTNAIIRAVKFFIEAGELQEIPRSQMQEKYKTGGRAYVVTAPDIFVKNIKDIKAE